MHSGAKTTPQSYPQVINRVIHIEKLKQKYYPASILAFSLVGRQLILADILD